MTFAFGYVTKMILPQASPSGPITVLLAIWEKMICAQDKARIGETPFS
jgi:hypothetical protein